jgi:hypothetical protein
MKTNLVKSSVKSTPFFSAYPLKLVKESSPPSASSSSPYLRSVLAGKVKSTGKTRIFAMVNPYTLKNTAGKRMAAFKEVEPRGEEWFNHYE